jgi:tetratricopeptide (TPR) repeat protein
MLGWNNPAPNRLVSIINDLPQEDFEAITKKLLKEMRFNITSSSSTGKYLEFEATREGDEENRIFLIKASRSGKKVTPEEIQTTVGKKKGTKEMSPVFISTGGFTDEANKYGDLLNVSLADGEKLMLLLQKFDMADDIEKRVNQKILEADGNRFLPSVDELENNMKWGNDFYNSGNYKKAIEYYDSALKQKSQYDLAWLMKGNALSAMTWYDEALECFKKVLEYNPESEEAWYNLGATLFHMGRFDDELACYDRALEIRPDYTKAWNNKGATLHQMGKFEEAVMCYDRVLKLEPDNVNVLNNRGVALKNLKEFDEALESFNRAIRKKEDYIDAWLNKGILLHDMERYEDAIACYDVVLGKWKSPEVLCQRGVALSMIGKYRQAIENFEASLSLKPGWIVAIEEKAKAEKLMKEEVDNRIQRAEEEARRLEAERLAAAELAASHIEAERALEAQRAAEAMRVAEAEKLARRIPEPIEPEFGCPKCGTRLGEEARFCSGCGAPVGDEIDERLLPVGKPRQLEAIEDQEAIRQALDREELLIEKSRLLRTRERYDGALKAMEEALGISERPEIWLEKANVLAAMGRADDAIEAYDRVLKTQPDNFLALSNKELMLSGIGELSAALKANGKVTELEPKWPQSWLRRASIQRKLGKLKEAVESLDRVLDISPGLAEVWNAQGATLLELGKHDKAIICLDRAIQIDPDFAEAWANKGAAMVASGQNEKSLQYFDRAVDIDQENSSAWANKGSALYNMGRLSEAIECFDEAMTITRTKNLLNSKGWALLGNDDPAAAIEAFEEAIAMDQNYAEAWNNRGLAYSRKEEMSEAFDSFDRALAIAPDFEDARKNRDATVRRIEQLAGKVPPKTDRKGQKITPIAKPELQEAIREAEKLEQEDIETEEFKCPFCGALGSIEDVFCEKCGQKFSRTMKEDAVEEKLEDILDIEVKKLEKEPEKKKPAKKTREDLIEGLVTVPGVGYAKAETILEAGFDSEKKLVKASADELAAISGIGDGLARKIKKKYK